VASGSLPFGGANSRAFGINERVDITGAAQTTTGAFHAFLWRDDKMYDLNQFLPPNNGWFLLEATDINEAGQVLCLARTKNGQLRAVLITPPGAGK
jgi:probable HAF family extracellular repeat protein